MSLDNRLLSIVAVLIAGYLLGSVPSAYLLGRLVRGIDIRQYGTGSIGSSNVYEQVGKGWLLVAGLLDVVKAALPSWLALKLGLGDGVAVAAGLAAVVGHCWPLFLAFHGGRGISPCLGVLVVLFPWGFLYELLLIGVGSLARHALINLLGLATLPLLAWVMGESGTVLVGTAAMFALVSIKRMEANRTPLPDGQAAWTSLLKRLVLDRDADNWDTWISRRPEGADAPWRIAAKEQADHGDTRDEGSPPAGEERP